MNLSKKISITFIMLLIAIIFGGLIVIRLLYGSFSLKKLSDQVEYSSKLIANQVENSLDNVEKGSAALVVSINGDLKEEFKTIENWEMNTLGIRNSLYYRLSSQLNINKEIYGAYVITKGDLVYSAVKPNFVTSVNRQQNIYKSLKECSVGVHGIWIEQKSEADGRNRYYQVRELKNIATMEGVGFIVLEIDKEIFRKIFLNEKMSEYMKCYILDKKQNDITKELDTEEADLNWQEVFSELAPGNGSIQVEEQTFFYDYQEIEGPSWSLISLLDKSQLKVELNKITYLILCVGILGVFGVAIIVNVISKKLALPVVRMSEHIANTKNGLPTEMLVSHEYEEVEHLIDCFNEMAANNRKLFEQIQENERLKHLLEMKILQAQIRPHFLYNTLDTAYILVDMEQPKEAKQTIKLLVNYYRAVLNKGSNWAALEQEVGTVETYIRIQQVRYPGKIKYEISLDEDVKEIYVPTLILQPLVENSIYHGLKIKKKEGILRLISYLEGEWVYIEIQDNGNNLTKTRFDEVLNAHDNRKDESFGMKNIDDRLKLCYGQQSGLTFVPNDQGFTIVRVCIFLGSSEV